MNLSTPTNSFTPTDVVDLVHRYEFLFTSEHEALDELLRRREDETLKRRIHTRLGSAAIPILERAAQPTALLFRQLGTPTHEVLRFLETSHRLSLTPLILEYSGDKFVGARNPYKRTLGKLPIFQHRGSDGRDMVRYITVIDFNSFVGKRIADVCCISGMTLSEFHHWLLKVMTGREPREFCYDASEWFSDTGGVASLYYEPFFTLAIRDCIIFENFEETEHLKSFMQDIVMPAFASVTSQFGLRPLITRVVPKDEEQRLYWNAYPKEMASVLV